MDVYSFRLFFFINSIKSKLKKIYRTNRRSLITNPYYNSIDFLAKRQNLSLFYINRKFFKARIGFFSKFSVGKVKGKFFQAKLLKRKFNLLRVFL